MPEISVLLPVYNTPEPYLRECIESVLNQSLADFELLVVNDASSDENVEKVVLSYADARLVYEKNAVNLGISETRNRLIDKARGKYLAVMDHDDVSLPKRLEYEAAYLDAHPDIGIVSCQVLQFPRSARPRLPENDKEIKLAFMRSCAIVHPACMIRKSVLTDNKIRYEKEFSPAEDYALFARLLTKTKFHNLPEVLFRYRVHAANTSKTRADEMERATYSVQSILKVGNPVLYNEFLLRAEHVKRVRLLGFVPFVKIVSRGGKTKVYLFEKILILSIKSAAKYQEGRSR